MRRTILKYTLIVGAVLVVAFCGVVYLAWHGHIPSYADTEDISYAKLLGVRPSFNDGVCYYRLNLSRHDFDASGISQLKRLPILPKEQSAPIWWNPNRDSSLCFTGGGLGSMTENLYIYDSRREILFARCEWN